MMKVLKVCQSQSTNINGARIKVYRQEGEEQIQETEVNEVGIKKIEIKEAKVKESKV
jgi:predicted small secreted protein